MDDPQLDQPDNQNIRALWGDFTHSIESDHARRVISSNGYRATNVCLFGHDLA